MVAIESGVGEVHVTLGASGKGVLALLADAEGGGGMLLHEVDPHVGVAGGLGVAAFDWAGFPFQGAVEVDVVAWWVCGWGF